MVITDRFDHTIDEKGRLAIPSQVRNAMDPETDGSAFFLLAEDKYLQLIPEKLFLQEAGMAKAGITVSEKVAKARRLLFSTATKVEPDKTGRVIIPDRFRLSSKNHGTGGEALLGDDVTLAGVGDRLEIWNRAEYAGVLKELMAERHKVVTEAAEEMYAPVHGNMPVPAVKQ